LHRVLRGRAAQAKYLGGILRTIPGSIPARRPSVPICPIRKAQAVSRPCRSFRRRRVIEFLATMHLLRALYQIQETDGYLKEERLHELAARENVPLYRLQGLVSFY